MVGKDGIFHRPIAYQSLAGLAIVRRPVGAGASGTRARMMGSAIGCASSPIDREFAWTFGKSTRSFVRAEG